MLCATTDRFQMTPRRARVLHGDGRRDARRPRRLPVAYGGARGPRPRPTRSTSSPPTSTSGRSREFRSTSPWAVGQALAALGRHHSRPWLGRIDVPTAVVVTQRRPRDPAGPPARARPPHPRRDDPRHRRRPRRLRAGDREVRARVRSRRRRPSTRGGATSAAQSRPLAEPAASGRLRGGFVAAVLLIGVGFLRAPTAVLSSASSAGKRRARSSTSGIDSRQAMIPTPIRPLLDITVTLRPAPWKTGPSG